MRKYLLSIFFYCLFYSEVFAQCVTLRGDVKDLLTGSPIVLNIGARVNGNKKNLGKTNLQGIFQVQIPCEASELLLEGQGYKSIVIPIPESKIKQTFYVSLNTIPIEKQAVDRPYLQGEPKEGAMKTPSSKSDRTSARYFKVIDAQSKSPIEANVCLSYTKTEAKKCFDVSGSNQEKIIFKDEDIITVEVKSMGFQDYGGNLYVNKLDNKTFTYEISLSKPTNMVTIINPKAYSQVEIIDKNTKLLDLYKKDEFLYAFIKPNEQYTIKATLAGESFQKVLLPKVGLNLLVLDNLEKVIKPVPPKNIVDVPTKRDYIIYFNQSDFTLRADARKSLDSVLSILQHNSSYKAQITGYTDNIGEPEKNKILSEYRAKVSFSYLYNRKIPEKQLFWTGLGGKKPINNNETEPDRSKNRRVEIKITDE